jgi:ribosomal protein L11 methyltransferase
MPAAKKWLKITLSCPSFQTEAVSDILGVLSGSGVEIRPLKPAGTDAVSCFFPLEDAGGESGENKTAPLVEQVKAELADLYALYGTSLPEPATQILEDQDWSTSWQQYFKAFEIVPGLVVKPSWETCASPENLRILEMDPGMAFGTGQHESTRLALALLTECLRSRPDDIARVLDVGTGTGILAMAAAMFGAEHVLAVDNDPEAVAVALANVRHNRLDTVVEVADTPVENIEGRFDLVCANIVHDVLAGMAPVLVRLLEPGGFLVLAGILAGEQTRSIAGLYDRHGLRTAAAREEGEWSALLLHSASPSRSRLP